MSFSEVANELIKNYLPPGTTQSQLAAFQTHYAPTIIEKLKAKYDGKNVSRGFQKASPKSSRPSSRTTSSQITM